MITLDQGGNQSAQEDSGSENGDEVIEVSEPTEAGDSKRGNVPTVDINNGEINVPAANDCDKEATEAERDCQNILNKGKELTVLLDLMESATGTAERKTDNNDENGNQNPNPVEVLEIPDEENSEEEHDTELENANLQAWENRSAAQKRYYEELEAGRTRRKLIIRCMRNNAVVKLNRNDIPNWYRAHRRAKNGNDPAKLGEGTDSDSDEDDEVKFVGAILRSESKYGGAIDGATSTAFNNKEQTKKVSNSNAKKCKCGEHTTNIGETECSICKRQFLTIKDLQEHLGKVGQVCHEIGCQYQFGPKPVKRRCLNDPYDNTLVYSNAIAPWSVWMPKELRCLVDLPKLELSKKDHKEIREKGLNLKQYTPKFLKYHEKRLPVLVSGCDKPETTDEENGSKDEENHHKDCSPHSPCKTCRKIKKIVLRPSSEEADEETSYQSSEETETDWDDPHNGEHPDCTECEEIRADKDVIYLSTEEYDTDPDNPHDIGKHINCAKCEKIRADYCDDPECTEHGAGDN